MVQGNYEAQYLKKHVQISYIPGTNKIELEYVALYYHYFISDLKPRYTFNTESDHQQQFLVTGQYNNVDGECQIGLVNTCPCKHTKTQVPNDKIQNKMHGFRLHLIISYIHIL